MWRDNGFLGGWVAHNALVGNGAEAWRRMLNLYNRNSDWDLSVCTVATKGDAPCPEYAKRRRDFPTALREHLAENGYSIDGVASAPVVPVGPSFDCNKARTPSEIEICRSPRLAELDNILAAGYAFLKTTQGRPTADAIGIPYWRLIAQCEGDEGCIARRQTEEISALALAGRPFPCRHGRRPLRLLCSPNQRSSPLAAPEVAKATDGRSRRPSRKTTALPEPDFSSPRTEQSSRTPTSSRTARGFASGRTRRRRLSERSSRATSEMTWRT